MRDSSSSTLRICGESMSGVMNASASAWIAPWLIGMAVIDKLGQFNGGSATIPFWWDIVVVAAFSLAIFYFAVSRALPAEQAVDAIEDELAEESDAAV